MPERSPLTVRWNKLVLQAIRHTRTSPPLAARCLAMVHTAMYDAWSVYEQKAISTTTARYIKRHDNCGEDDMPKAVSYAAFTVCTHLFWLALPPERRNMFRKLMEELEYDPGDRSADTVSPQGIGNLVARLLIDCRSGDGANEQGLFHHAAPLSDYTGYLPKNLPVPAPAKSISHWQPQTGSDGKPQTFLLPHWPLVKPFALRHAAEFRAPAPYNSKDNPVEFRKQAEEIYNISQALTPMQKAIAEYWADGAGTVTPPGHWCEIAQYLADTHCKDYSEAESIRLFFALSNALLDASIACWDSKRKWDAVRPVTVIRELLRKRDWNPYIPTPPFAEHTSGHSTFSRASAVILRNFTGSDEFGAAGVVEKGSSLIEPGKPPEDIQLAPWKTFTAAAEEAGLSRIYGGIHFRKANEEGQKMGEQVGARVWEKVQFYFNDK